MAKDTITLTLDGEISFQNFADAISHFHSLVQALSQEMGMAEDIDWLIHDLQAGSATATVRGEAESPEKVEKVVSAYGELAKDLEGGRTPNFSTRVLREANAIAGMLDDRITSIRFETPEVDASISKQPNIVISTSTKVAIGAIEGRVQTLTNRKGLRFTLFDALHDRSVSCYIEEGRQEIMREIWGKRAIVEGEISRDIVSGRPLAIRRITNVRVLPEVEKGSYLAARAVAPRKPGALLPEQIIRRLRDAE